ncbi:hypothetical protein [Nitrosomonas eutropha]|uniref:hypothetical protein n=1 Tax=Nitrosomonas eutropha TaxID=916 RepID=UPI00115FE2EB|nr:hypothetical protein [Nitrosomonas eutropha]
MYASFCDNHKRRSDKRIGTGAMQNFAELHLKPETLARHDFSLGIALMIAGIACVHQFLGGR